jgi:hypothetical protein
MKNIKNLGLLFVLLLGFAGCKKENFDTSINGTWELRHVLGGQIAGASPDIAKGNGDIYKFDGKNYERFNNGKSIEKGTFTLTRENLPVNNSNANGSIVFSGFPIKCPVNLSKKKLVIFIGMIAADGIESTYEKIKP